MKNAIRRAYHLNGGAEIKTTVEGGSTMLHIDRPILDPTATVIVVEFDGHRFSASVLDCWALHAMTTLSQPNGVAARGQRCRRRPGCSERTRWMRARLQAHLGASSQPTGPQRRQRCS